MTCSALMSRFEAAYQLAAKKHPQAYGHIEALMKRLPPMVRPIFPYFFAFLGTKEATANNLVLTIIINYFKISNYLIN